MKNNPFFKMAGVLGVIASYSIVFLFGGVCMKKQRVVEELDSTTKLMVMHGDTPDKILSVPDGVGDGRYVMVLGKTKAFIYDTTQETAGVFQKETIESKMGEEILGKEHLRIMREHFAASR